MTTQQIDAFAKYQLATARVAHLRSGVCKLAALASLAFLLMPFFGGPVGAVGLLCLVAALGWLGYTEVQALKIAPLERKALYPRPNRRQVVQTPRGGVYR